MATDVGVGDIEVPYLDVTPGDGTTVGTLTVTDPAGTETTPTVTAGTPSGGTVRLTAAAVTYDAPGRWLLHWDVTGTGAGAEDQEVYVVASPVAGGPTWAPGRSRVANYVPGRTLSTTTDTHELTFSATTRPTGVAVDRLIADAASWVLAATGAVDDTLADTASVAAALRAAAAVERGYPEQDQVDAALRRADALDRSASAMRADLVRANEAVTGANTTNPASTLLPLYAFPDAPAWADLDL
jgi:hypothetical protein